MFGTSVKIESPCIALVFVLFSVSLHEGKRRWGIGRREKKHFLNVHLKWSSPHEIGWRKFWFLRLGELALEGKRGAPPPPPPQPLFRHWEARRGSEEAAEESTYPAAVRMGQHRTDGRRWDRAPRSTRGKENSELSQQPCACRVLSLLCPQGGSTLRPRRSC